MTRSLAVDLGGTHIRFGLLQGGVQPAAVHDIETSTVRNFEDALGQWRKRAGVHEWLDAIAIASAGPVAGHRAHITNLDWILDARAIERNCHTRRCVLVNDVAAIAWALPVLRRKDLRTLAAGISCDGSTRGEHGSATNGPGSRMADDPRGTGSHTPDDRTTKAVIAPGTGLGMSALVAAGMENLVAVEGEGGHRTLAAQTPREWAIVTVLAERFGHASAERALSGPGIEAMWRALASIDGARCDRDMTAADIARDAFARRDPIAQETIAVFTGFLGSVAGDLALTLGARGGVYIAGGIVPGWGERFDARLFLDRFRAKGRFRTYLSAIPVHVVTHPYPGLVGVEYLMEHHMAGRF